VEVAKVDMAVAKVAMAKMDVAMAKVAVAKVDVAMAKVAVTVPCETSPESAAPASMRRRIIDHESCQRDSGKCRDE
jgi:hypothetical protein